MRSETDRERLEQFMARLGERVSGPGSVYLVGGSTAVLEGWRPATIDVDLKADPEPAGFFEAIAELKDELNLNVELASPEQFIPALPGWHERSRFIGRHGRIEFFHYDFYAQALAKLQRKHQRDRDDVAAMLRHGLIEKPRLWQLFEAIEPQLMRFPGIDAATFRKSVREFCDAA